ncbi:MAG: ATP-dependent DNA helicase [Bacteroidetes bacterium CG02_land_8_20_14_3_00_31_25]|nr:UvrD-helicase domain-containing protein [Bacteroidota bacterium]PIV62585.1 MAG: ATP-dependent DNA helicase [Bacteroidetes bacterium CG02_land_8_20_14_3_00_31_25]
MKNFLDELNPAQREAVVNFKGPNLIIAGAGSGKTRVLTYRIAYLLQQRVFAGNIMALTFTNKAAKEMKERIVSLVGFENSRYLWMGTFHSIFAKILRSEASKIDFSPKFTIYDTDDSKSQIKAIVKELHFDDKQYKTSEVHNRISMAKNNLVTAANYVNSPIIQEQDLKSRRPQIGKIYSIYQSRLKTSDAMDFDDLLLFTNILFRDNADIAEKYQKHFKYLLVDEYQDTNYAQYLIIKKLCELSQNISVVGDDSQSIYSFRGAKIENILNFKKDYPALKLFKLEQNYRSTKNIVEAANSLINRNRNRIPKKVWSNNEEGDKIKVQKAFTDTEEGFMVANLLKEYKSENNFKFNDFVILYRINAQSRIFEESFRRSAIPYKVYGGLSFYQRKEVKDVIAYLRLVVNHNDDEAFKRIINYPARGIGKTTLEKVESISVTNNMSLWNTISAPKLLQTEVNQGTISRILNFKGLIEHFSEKNTDTDAFELSSYIVSQTGILRDLEADKSQESINRKQNIEELLNGIKDFCETSLSENPEAKVLLENYLENVSLLTDFDTTDDNEEKDRVALMTVHSAKGLEFNCVFIVGAEHELFPLYFNGVAPENIEEERRLFYVALTRAKKIANISFAENRYRWGKPVTCQPSSFISEIDKEFLDMAIEIDEENKPSSYNDKFNKKGTLLKSEMFKPEIKFSLKEKKLVHLNIAEKTNVLLIDKKENINIIEGATVIHNRFGKGIVIRVEGENSNTKALINFDISGEKQLLLKFAKLKVI